MYQGALSIETYMSWVETINCISYNIANKDSKQRFIFYHIFINFYNIIVSFILIICNYYGTTNRKNIDFMCYVNLRHKYDGIIFSTIPLLIVILIMIFICVLIISQLIIVFGTGLSFSRESDIHIRQAFSQVLIRIGTRGKLTIMRLILLPILFLCAACVIVAYDTFWYDSSNEVPGVIAYCVYSIGPVINCIVWIFTDR